MPRAFEWDPRKNAANIEKHGIDFVCAVRIFERSTLEREDTRRDYGETRIMAVGQTGDLVLTVVYTPRSEVYRIISARSARRDEEQTYQQLRPE